MNEKKKKKIVVTNKINKIFINYSYKLYNI